MRFMFSLRPLHVLRFTLHASRFTRYASRSSSGFTLLEVIGVLAVMATLMAIIAPTVIDQMDRTAQKVEAENLQAIAEGVKLYLRDNRAWPPNLSALSPDYLSFGNAQLLQNARGYPRYFIVHPSISGYANATGITSTQLADARFLLISDLSQDANPTINNGTQFDSWWNTDETATPDLQIYRGHVGTLFRLLSISAVGGGGSYRIDGTATNSGGNVLASHGNYHVAGTLIEFDEDNNFSPGNFALSVTLAADAGFQFDPGCVTGTQWHVLGSNC